MELTEDQLLRVMDDLRSCLCAELEATAQSLFDVVAGGAVRIDINQRYNLADVAQAHIELEARKTTGSSILLP